MSDKKIVAAPEPLSGVEEFRIKKADAENRMKKTFAVFIKSGPHGYSLFAGEEPPVLYNCENFISFIISPTVRESEELLQVLKECGSEYSRIFSSEDFHTKAASDFLSDYLFGILSDIKAPIALAAEFMAFDRASSSLYRVFYSGDVKVDDAADSNFLFIGLYDDELMKNLVKEFKQLGLDKADMRGKDKAGKKKANDLAKATASLLEKKYGFKVVNFIT